jgi:hypothetical protein
VVACGIGGAGGIHGVAPRRGVKEFMIGVFGGNDRAQRKGFENTRDLACDLLLVKNAGVTNLPKLK